MFFSDDWYIFICLAHQTFLGVCKFALYRSLEPGKHLNPDNLFPFEGDEFSASVGVEIALELEIVMEEGGANGIGTGHVVNKVVK